MRGSCGRPRTRVELGGGSALRVRLPALAADVVGPGAGDGRAVERRVSRGPLRIVLIEDNDDAREALRELLELWGHEVHVATDGEGGLATPVLPTRGTYGGYRRGALSPVLRGRH